MAGEMQLGVMFTAGCMGADDWAAPLEEWSRAGLEAVDLLDFCRFFDVEFPKLGLDQKAVAERLSSLGLSVPVISVRTDLVSADPNVRAESLDDIRKAVAACPMFRSGVVFNFGGQHTNSGEEAKKRFIDGLDAACSIAAEGGVAFSIENAGTLCGTADELLEVVRAVGEDRLKVTIDPGNFLIARLDPVECVRKLVDVTVHVHVKDLHEEEGGAHPPYEYCTVGEGLSGWQEIFDMLKDAGYRGMLEFEPSGKVPPKQTPHNLEAIRSML